MSRIVDVLSNLKRTLKCIYFDRSNRDLLGDGYIILRSLLTSHQIESLREAYSFARRDREMASDGADQRSVFYDFDLINGMLLSHPLVSKTVSGYTPSHRNPAFVMRNLIVDTSLEGSGGGWHRDSYNPSLKIFIPLSRCTERNGATVFMLGSHTWRSKIRDFAYGPRIKYLGEPSERLSQPELWPGDVVIADTSCIHRGGRAAVPGRDMLTVYFSHPGVL